MVSDLALARLAFAQSTNSVDAQIRVAALRLEVENLRTEAKGQAMASGVADADVSVDLTTAPTRVDKLA